MPQLDPRMVCSTCLVQYFVESGYRTHEPVCAYCGKFRVVFATDEQIAGERKHRAQPSNKPADVLPFPQPAE